MDPSTSYEGGSLLRPTHVQPAQVCGWADLITRTNADSAETIQVFHTLVHAQTAFVSAEKCYAALCKSLDLKKMNRTVLDCCVAHDEYCAARVELEERLRREGGPGYQGSTLALGRNSGRDAPSATLPSATPQSPEKNDRSVAPTPANSGGGVRQHRSSVMLVDDDSVLNTLPSAEDQNEASRSQTQNPASGRQTATGHDGGIPHLPMSLTPLRGMALAPSPPGGLPRAQSAYSDSVDLALIGDPVLYELRQDSKLTKLNVSNSYMGVRGVLAVLAVLPHLSYLREVDFSSSDLDSSLVVLLCQVCRPMYLPYLTTLKLNRNPFGSIAGEALVNLAEASQNLYTIRYEGAEIIGPVCRRLEKRLRLNAEQLEKQLIMRSATAVSRNQDEDKGHDP